MDGKTFNITSVPIHNLNSFLGQVLFSTMGSSRPREEEDEGPPHKMMRTDSGSDHGSDNGSDKENGVSAAGEGEALVKIGFSKASKPRCQPDDITKLGKPRCQPDDACAFEPRSKSILFPGVNGHGEDGLDDTPTGSPAPDDGLTPEERQKAQEELNARLDEENAEKYRCGLCSKKRQYFERLFELHDHLLEFHLVLNDEEEVNKYVVQPLRPAPTVEYPPTAELLGPYEPEPQDPLIFEPQTFRPTYEEFKDLQVTFHSIKGMERIYNAEGVKEAA